MAKSTRRSGFGLLALTQEELLKKSTGRLNNIRKKLNAFKTPDHYHPSCDCYDCNTLRWSEKQLVVVKNILHDREHLD